MLEDAEASVLLTQEGLLGLLPSERLHVVCVDTDWEVIAQEGQENVDSGVTGENLALCDLHFRIDGVSPRECKFHTKQQSTS